MLPSRSLAFLVSFLAPLISVYHATVTPENLEKLSSIHSLSFDGASSAENRMLEWYQLLDQSYSNPGESVNITLETGNNKQYAADTARNVTDRIFKPRRQYLENTVAKAEEIAKSYNWDSAVTIDRVNCCDAKTFEYSSGTADFRSSRFPTPVNFSHSTVHIPVEVYEGEMATLRGLDWTSQLDKLWIQNENEARVSEDEEDLLWQYFGSEEGFTRNYPGSRWPDSEVDLYDARRRPWYNQGAGSPKDVLILIDTSGSTVGQTLYLMQLTVQKLMDTLGEDDYIQVANFSDAERMNETRARLGPDCYPNFVQATAFNKAMLMEYVNKLDNPQGQANFEVALKYAYKTFEEFDKQKKEFNTLMGSNCSKIIIILTDGGIERPESVIYEHDKEKVYRIFTFAMGLNPTPLDAVKWLACENRGYFAYIDNIGSINRAIREYTHVLSRPLEYDVMKGNGDTSPVTWSYPDMTTGFGMLTTLTKPVFNKTDMANVTLLGVMAADVAIVEFDQFVKFRELGPLGYTFIINHNGFVVRHPVLRSESLWNMEPPSIDLMEAEVVAKEESLSDIKKVRDKMIDKMKYNTVINHVGVVLSNGDNPAYFLPYSADYHVVDISETAYRLGVVHPQIINHVIQVEGMFDVSVLDDLVDQAYDVTVARWGLCERIYHLNNETELLKQFKIRIENDTVKCDMSMVNHLLWDATMLRDSRLYELVNNGTANAVFFTSAGGLTATYIQDYSKGSFKFNTNYPTAGSKKAFANRDQFIYTAPYTRRVSTVEVNTTGPQITVYKAVHNSDDSKPYIYGVVGLSINNTAMTEVLVGLTADSGEQLCNISSRCFILDDGGFIISESESAHGEGKSNIGRWLGDVDKSLMYGLYESGIYLRHRHFDYQVICTKTWLEQSSSATCPRIPTLARLAEIFLTKWTATTALLYNGAWSLFNSMGSVDADKLKHGEKYVICTKVSYQYYFSKDAKHEFRLYTKNSCVREFDTQPINNSNLLLVIADKPNPKCEGFVPLEQAPVELHNDEYVEKNPTVCDRHKRRRDPPTSSCFNVDKPGFRYTCDACHQAKLNRSLVMLAVLLWWSLS